MLDALGCGPEDITHVSSSFRYDLMTAYDLGIKTKVWVNRGHEPANPYYEYTEIKDIGGLAGRRSGSRRRGSRHEARVLLARHRAALRARRARGRSKDARMSRSSAAASPGSPPRWRWRGAAPGRCCSRPAASPPRPRGATAAMSATASRTASPPSPPSAASSRRRRCTAPSPPPSTPSSASCARRRSTAPSSAPAGSSSRRSRGTSRA